MKSLHTTKERLREFRERVLRMSPEQIVQVAGGIFTVKHIENTESFDNPYSHVEYVDFLVDRGNMNRNWASSGKGDMVNSHNVSQSGSNSMQQAQGSSSINANCGECKLVSAFALIADKLADEKDKRIEILQQMNEARLSEVNWLMQQGSRKAE